ncbi:tRNA-splicing endonuclease subunit Sen34-like [Oculina patagonica]
MADDEDETPVTLFSRFGKVYVWSADDAFKIRSKYRIVGSLIGSFSRKRKQNHSFSLPLLLSQEEATLLLHKGLARIFNMPKRFSVPSKEEVETFNELRRDSVVKQIALFQKEREEKLMELAEVIEEGRRRKRNRKKCDDDDGEASLASKKMKSEELSNEGAEDCTTKEEGECNQSSEKCDEGNNDMERNQDETCSRIEVIQADSEKTTTVNTVEQESNDKLKNKCDISNVSANSDIHCEETKPFSELKTLTHIPTIMPQRLQTLLPVDWTYPQTESEKLRYRVFLDLWEKGYYLTPGAKFGGNLLAYPGDPMRYHSFYIVIIIPWKKKITPFEIISAGRLGATVKKTALLCSVSDGTGEVVYTSVKWSGIS